MNTNIVPVLAACLQAFIIGWMVEIAPCRQRTLVIFLCVIGLIGNIVYLIHKLGF
jgi:hypothetical protein